MRSSSIGRWGAELMLYRYASILANDLIWKLRTPSPTTDGIVELAQQLVDATGGFASIPDGGNFNVANIRTYRARLMGAMRRYSWNDMAHWAQKMRDELELIR